MSRPYNLHDDHGVLLHGGHLDDDGLHRHVFCHLGEGWFNFLTSYISSIYLQSAMASNSKQYKQQNKLTRLKNWKPSKERFCSRCPDTTLKSRRQSWKKPLGLITRVKSFQNLKSLAMLLWKRAGTGRLENPRTLTKKLCCQNFLLVCIEGWEMFYDDGSFHCSSIYEWQKN